LNLQLHADRTRRALVHGAQLAWLPSPQPGVERRMLERSGGEIAIASTIVRYQKGSAFPAHLHECGEEFMVLEGTFSDERGDYPAGSYVRNPPHSTHTPFSRDGCIIFVKLRQMKADEIERICVLPHERTWEEADCEQCVRSLLYSHGMLDVSLMRLEPGASVQPHTTRGGEELFVLNGSVRLLDGNSERLDAWSWLRQPGTEQPGWASENGALLWVKRGHLAG
jgi:anti-sigma factor ChrR (cupin superfamily)